MHIIHLVSNKSWGGGEQYVYDLARAMAAAGNRIDVVTRPLPVLVDKFTEGGLAPLATMPLKGAIDIVSPLRLATLLRNADDDVIVHVHNFKDAIVALRARTLSGKDNVRVVLTRHLVKAAKTTRSYRQLYQGLDAIVFVSQLARDEFMSTAPAVDPDKIHVVHNSIVVPEALPATIPGCRAGMPVVMCHGRISPEKGIDVLLDAMALISELPWQLVIVGAGDADYTAKLKAKAQSLGIDERVIWTGFRADVHGLIAQATVGVVPSVVRESFGLSVLDYMSHGVALVTTNNGAQPEYLRDGVDALLCVPSSPQALAKAIGKLLSDNELRTRIAQAGKEAFAERLSYPVFLDKIGAVYKSVLSK